MKNLIVLFCCLWFGMVTPANSAPAWFEDLPFSLHGFLEGLGGLRTQDDPQQSKDLNPGEIRLQLEATTFFEVVEFQYRGDILYDGVLEEFDFDLREANMAAFPLEFMDLKIGRQILTWGTGDLIFLNDLFPKDFRSFFIGRHEEYLKAPSDALKASVFIDRTSLDVVWTPRFNSDRFLTGERLSYFNPLTGQKAGERSRLPHVVPTDWVQDSEVALRLYRNFQGYELAAYGYYGFFKNPGGVNRGGQAIFPRLSVYGASVRGHGLKGIGNVEIAYYDSLDDRNGTDPFIDNSQVRLLFGYTQEVVTDFSVGVQYNLERMQDHDEFIQALPSGGIARDANRHVTTLRLTHLFFQHNLRLSLFTVYSPSDNDFYLRPNVQYHIGDAWTTTLGSNIFLREDEHTFFGQLEDNSNVYARLRYSF